MIEPFTRPRLARKVKMRFDERTGKYVLLMPEKGLVLNRTASAVTSLCTGKHSVVAIIEKVLAEHTDAPREQAEAEVFAFPQSLDDRGLLEVSL